MAKIRINKFEAARRQIDMAIRCHFRGEDVVGVHTLSMAAFRILRDIAGQTPDSVFQAEIDKLIKPGHEARFWKTFNTFSNFCKHADNDKNAILDSVDDQVNDFPLFMCCRLYSELGYQLTPEMRAFVLWFAAIHPDLRESGVSQPFGMGLLVDGLKRMPRHEQLQFGLQAIEFARASSPR